MFKGSKQQVHRLKSKKSAPTNNKGVPPNPNLVQVGTNDDKEVLPLITSPFFVTQGEGDRVKEDFHGGRMGGTLGGRSEGLHS